MLCSNKLLFLRVGGGGGALLRVKMLQLFSRCQEFSVTHTAPESSFFHSWSLFSRSSV